MKKGLLFFVLLCLLACQKQGSDENIKIGIFQPLSGLYEESGKEITKGIQLAQEEKQYILGKKVKLLLYDTKSLEFESANAVSYFSGQKVTAMLGTYGVKTMANALPVIEAAHIPTIASGSTYSQVQKSEWTSSLFMNDVQQATAMAQFAEEHLQLKNIAIMVDEELEYGDILAYTFSHQVSGQVKIHFIPYHTGDTSFDSQLRRLKTLSAEGVYCPGDPVVSAYLVSAIRKEFPYISIMGGDRWENPSFFQMGKSSTQGAYFTGHYSPQKLTSAKGAHFIAAYKKKYGTSPNSFSAQGYDSYMALAYAMEQAQSLDPYKIQYEIRNIKNFPGVTDTIQVEYEGESLRPVKILQQEGPRAYLKKTVEVKY